MVVAPDLVGIVDGDDAEGVPRDEGVDHESDKAPHDEDQHDEAEDVGAAAEVVGHDGLLELVLLVDEGLLETAPLLLAQLIRLVHLLQSDYIPIS